MREPSFTKEGYPTDETLEIIEKWEIKDIEKDCEDLLSYICAAWKYPERAKNTRKGIWTFST